MKIRILLALLLLLLAFSAHAQKNKSVRVKLTPEEKQRMEKMERMQAATEKVMFIDSFIVRKSEFLRYYHPSPECGSMKRTAGFYHNEKHADCYAYLNELGNKCFFSKYDNDSTSNLYMTDYESGKWSNPIAVSGINDHSEFQKVNYPFMMGDGQTFYFAAESDKGIGGYDIYMTTYDEESGRFLHPTNIGMPFNSEANDYMLVIDEYDSLGWFATDRRQPSDMVCVYVFIPSHIRRTYNSSDYTTAQVKNFAQIASIADTWDDMERRRLALNRLQQHTNPQKQTASIDEQNSFVINDDVTYQKPSDFHHPHNADRYRQLLTMRAQQKRVSESLAKRRKRYANASEKERQQLSVDIRSDERRILQLNRQAHDMEKSIRNTENIFLTH